MNTTQIQMGNDQSLVVKKITESDIHAIEDKLQCNSLKDCRNNLRVSMNDIADSDLPSKEKLEKLIGITSVMNYLTTLEDKREAEN